MDNILDIFKTNAFGLVRMTDAINKQVFVPGRLGQLGIFDEAGVDTIDIAIEEREGLLYLVPNRERGADPTQNAKEQRKIRVLRSTHLPVSDRIYAREIQGVRAFGTGSQLETIQGKVNERLFTMAQSLEATLEHHRVGAVKGVVYDADGTTVLYNLFTEFGISPYSTVNFDFDPAAADTGQQRKRCAGIVRNIVDALGAANILGVHAICGNNFFDDLLQEPEVRNSFKNTSMATVLRDGYVYPNGLKVYGAFEFGGIVWENYRGSVGSTNFVNTEMCHMFPVGVPGLFKTAFAPADDIDAVNTTGRPMYAKTTLDPKRRWVEVDAESNPLVYCTRPKVLMTGLAHT